ncbi:hypothetical protein JIN85_12075 [Luteolibacter pohnpeiensis]|uniref:Uncharacterized protein n=1 Tax=Luteolibacter pohnpeiensis TaxID=454153 RepID=A0A934VX40_9BACT|nr:hypothetical protein [Luteolibacter pohnpeiensis]MBK1883159.1 hypothetical protein [Luteolibacter pohnpeiensis]
MKIVFNSLVIVAAGAAVFFSFSLSSKFKEEQSQRLSAKHENERVTTKAEGTEATLAETEAQLKDAQDQRELLSQSITTLKSTEKSLKRDMADAEATIKQQQAELTSVEETIQQLKDSLKEFGGDITLENLGDKIAEIEDANAAKKTKIEELESNSDAAEKRIASTKAESDRLTQKSNDRKARIAQNATEAVVTAVNQDWGFLVIGAGSNSGFAPQGKLLVKRDGRLIGSVAPSAIEATQTVANIDMDSLSPGVRIQPGDRVILATPASN